MGKRDILPGSVERQEKVKIFLRKRTGGMAGGTGTADRGQDLTVVGSTNIRRDTGVGVGVVVGIVVTIVTKKVKNR